MQRMNKVIAVLALCMLVGCNIPDRLSRIGVPPAMNDVVVYEQPKVDVRDQDEVSEELPHTKTANALWRPGARTFFRDNRARSIGDILKVEVIIADSAKLDSKSTTVRNDNGKIGFPKVGGLEQTVGKVFPKDFDPTNFLDVSAQDSNSGSGQISRKEDINTTIAATVIRILPSNNLMIKGSQEIRLNNEVREITIEGIVRPEDISAQNSVTLDQIAEARVSYGGRGNVSDYQQPRYGKQIMDIISPF